MANCPSNCGDVEIVSNPPSDCTIALRRKTIARLLFYKCDTALPDPVTNVNMKALFDADGFVGSVELANIVVNDPTTEDIVFSDCVPPLKVIGTREITFEDRAAITNSASPANKYWDYNFWANKNDIQTQLRYMIAYCDGDVVIPTNPTNGQPLSASLLIFLTWQKSQTPGAASVEFKKGSIVFQGDPFDMHQAKPAFNYIDAGIDL